MESGFRDLGIIARGFLDGLFPRFCLRCKKEGEYLCISCREGYRPGPAPEMHKTRALDGCLALGWYKDPVLRDAIRLAKYYGDAAVWDVMECWIRSSNVFLQMPAGSWVISPVPLHVARQRERGFNQAERIARIVAVTNGWLVVDLLKRTVWTDPQARRGADHRTRGDLEGIFEATDDVPSHVLLCDDVFTTGATMDAAASALKQAGAKVVWGFTLARG